MPVYRTYQQVQADANAAYAAEMCPFPMCKMGLLQSDASA